MEVVVYGKPNCPFCDKAKNILKSKGIDFQYIDISVDEKSFEFIRSKGFRTVPQIFVNGEYHGESDSANTVGELLNKRVVLKRDGRKEPWSADKLNSMAEWAVANAEGVNWSSIAMAAVRKLPDGIISSSTIQDALIQACIDKEDYQHNKVAGRLLLGDLRNSSIAPKDFKVFYEWAVEEGHWRDMNYSEEDIEYLANFIDHDYDLKYGYPTIRQFLDKYLKYDGKGRLVELPQFMYMGVAMSLMEGGSLEDVVTYYLKARANKINIPSPVLSGQRTKSNIGVSCVITTAGDSLHGIEAAKHIAFMSTASSAGLGVEYDVRSPKDDVRDGYAKAGGKLPHYKTLNRIVKEVTQSARGGSATVSFEAIDPEITNLLRLKLPRSPEERRIELLDYSFKVNHDIIRRAAKREKMALVSRKDYPELYEEFYSQDMTRFSKLMDEILNDPSAKKTVVNAFDVVDLYLEVRSETGRLYRYNVTEGNRHTPFKETIRLSNL
jgi:ribonucleotide reductase alpha subunit/glutaredoxin